MKRAHLTTVLAVVLAGLVHGAPIVSGSAQSFDPRNVIVPLKAATVKEATERLAERLVGSGAVADPQRLNAVLRNTWPEDMVSVGEHAFLPHFRTEAVRQLVAAVGVSPTPIRWEKDPHRTARVVILVVAPPRDTPTYLQALGSLARVLSTPTPSERAVSSPAEMRFRSRPYRVIAAIPASATAPTEAMTG